MAAIPKADVWAVRRSGYPYSHRSSITMTSRSRLRAPGHGSTLPVGSGSVVWSPRLGGRTGLRDRVRLVRGGGRRGEVEQARGAQLVDARQLGQGVQAEMGEEVRGRRPEERAAGAGASPL